MAAGLRFTFIALLAISFLVLGVFSVADEADFESLIGAGDVREGYENKTYTSRSKSLQQRVGKETDLYAFYKNVPFGLPPLIVPDYNPMTREGIHLGRRLFFDRRLSINNTMSCAMCHVPEMAFTHYETQVAMGVEGRVGRRNAPTLLNSAYKTRLFHDGREVSLENQIWGPLLSRHEMANPSVGYVLEKIKKIKDYDGLFEQTFGKRGVSIETVSMALAQYQRVLVSANSRFDRWYYGKEKTVLTDTEKAGFEIFMGKGQCVSCHLINKKHALFTDNQWHNTGLGFHESMRKTPPTTRVQLAPGLFTELDQEIIQSVTAVGRQNDLGLYEITEDPNDRWKYVTPTLRNISLTQPYMHNGSFSTLEEVIEFYDRGGIKNELLSPLIRPLGLNSKEKQMLIDFLHTLNGDNIETLVSDAFAAPVGELSADDPFWANQRFKSQ